MSCRRTMKSLLDYSDGVLPDAERDAVERHLEQCQSCAATAEKLSLSGLALGTIREDEQVLSEFATTRIAASLREEQAHGVPAVPQPGFLGSARAIGAAAAVAALLLVAIVVVAVNMSGGGGGGVTQQNASSPLQLGKSVPATSSPAAQQEATGVVDNVATLPVPLMPKPVVKATTTDYNQDSLKAMLDSEPVVKQFSQAYSMSDALRMNSYYSAIAGEEFAKLGQDARVLEQIITYITASEPAMLPCYVEKALYTGQDVWIIGLAAPSRNATTDLKLTRIEVWVMDPVKFGDGTNPDPSLVLFLEHQY